MEGNTRVRWRLMMFYFGRENQIRQKDSALVKIQQKITFSLSDDMTDVRNPI